VSFFVKITRLDQGVQTTDHIDLDSVVHVRYAAESYTRELETEKSLKATVTLAGGGVVELSGEAAATFLGAFTAHLKPPPTSLAPGPTA
jgi:hypothetical protein